MKKSLLIVALTVFFVFTACTPVIYRNMADCDKSDVDVFKDITTILMQEEFTIKNANENIGFLVAERETAPLYAGGYGSKIVWEFNVRNGKIMGTYKTFLYESNLSGGIKETMQPTYGSDKTGKGEVTYWNVRNSIERVCNSKIVVMEVK
ncbi:MAG: hypothetical protein M9949_14415 [Candidatus Kapabacteria bacterium]|nr:hypothetical protein [Candidatus Kapabacteria bacterium]